MPCGTARANPVGLGNGDIDNHLCGVAFGRMLVCQCNVISEREIVQIVRDQLAQDPWQITCPPRSTARSKNAENAPGVFPTRST